MLLALDLGNTELTIGAFDGEELTQHWRLTPSLERTEDEWAITLKTLLQQNGDLAGSVRAAVVASVVPPATERLIGGIERAAGVSTCVVTPRSALPITLDVDEPLTVGADRMVNALAAAEIYGRDVVVVDFGTATTFDCVTADRRFIGGVIMPGLRTMSDELVRRTAKLPATELTSPPSVIGRRTEDCVRAGVLFGAAEAVDGLVRRIREAWPTSEIPHVVATGGLAKHVVSLTTSIAEVHPTLTLVGLRLAAAFLGARW